MISGIFNKPFKLSLGGMLGTECTEACTECRLSGFRNLTLPNELATLFNGKYLNETLGSLGILRLASSVRDIIVLVKVFWAHKLGFLPFIQYLKDTLLKFNIVNYQ